MSDEEELQRVYEGLLSKGTGAVNQTVWDKAVRKAGVSATAGDQFLATINRRTGVTKRATEAASVLARKNVIADKVELANQLASGDANFAAAIDKYDKGGILANDRGDAAEAWIDAENEGMSSADRNKMLEATFDAGDFDEGAHSKFLTDWRARKFKEDARNAADNSGTSELPYDPLRNRSTTTPLNRTLQNQFIEMAAGRRFTK